MKVKLLVLQSCPTLCDPTDCSPPGSSVHGILQARILKWIAIPSRGSSRPRDQTWISCTAGRFFIIWATGEAPSRLYNNKQLSFELSTQKPAWLFYLKNIYLYINYKVRALICICTFYWTKIILLQNRINFNRLFYYIYHVLNGIEYVQFLVLLGYYPVKHLCFKC